MTGNQFQNNIVVTGLNTAGQGYLVDNSPSNPMSISNYFYKNYTRTSIKTTRNNGAGGDTNAVQTGASPLISCWAPTIASAA
jgi:hypothetical protein